jgi:hypothetical protein
MLHLLDKKEGPISQKFIIPLFDVQIKKHKKIKNLVIADKHKTRKPSVLLTRTRGAQPARGY